MCEWLFVCAICSTDAVDATEITKHDRSANWLLLNCNICHRHQLRACVLRCEAVFDVVTPARYCQHLQMTSRWSFAATHKHHHIFDPRAEFSLWCHRTSNTSHYSQHHSLTYAWRMGGSGWVSGLCFWREYAQWLIAITSVRVCRTRTSVKGGKCTCECRLNCGDSWSWIIYP